MAHIDETGLNGKIRDRHICDPLRAVLLKAADAAGVDVVYITSGGQPGSTGQSVGSTRHDGGRAADLQLVVAGKTQTFDDADGGDVVERFVTAAAAHGATGIGAGVRYMGPATLHVGFGRTEEDHSRIVWGANGASANAPAWLREAASRGWADPPPAWVFQVFDRPPAQGALGLIERPQEPAIRIDVAARFPAEVVRAAQASQHALGIPASITLAQWALESGFGRHMPPGSNNPFGIKAKAGEPSVPARTTEVENGRRVSIIASFRAFSSLDEAFAAHARLLATAGAYAPARSFANDPDRFADALTGVYATDPNYGTLLKSIMRSNDLYRFDAELAEGTGPTGAGAASDATRPLKSGDVDMVLLKALQQRLVDLGYSLGKIDGKFGTLTAGALLAFQHDNGLAATGMLDALTQAALRTAELRPLSEDRIRTTEKDLAADGSRIVINAGRSRILSWIATALGTLGLGSSAVVNGAATLAPPAPSTLPDALLPFLTEVQKFQPSTPPAELQRVLVTAKSLAEQLGAPTVPPQTLQLIKELRNTLPPDLLLKNPDMTNVLDTIAKMPAKPMPMATIFDFLPTLMPTEGVVQSVLKGIAATAGSVLPGFGGSLAMLGIGLLGRLLANRIATARVEDHQNATNISGMKR